MSELVLVETADRIRTIRFNRPAKKNALTQDMYAAAAEALEAADTDPSVRVSIITGAEGVFTAGNDIVDFTQRPPDFNEQHDTPPVRRFMMALLNAQKPVVAAVDGLAIGIGVTMLLHCDLVVASSRAIFKTPFVDLALAPEFASSQLMPRIFGHAVAAELLLLGETWDATRARETGLVNRVTEPDKMDETARFMAAILAAKAPTSLKASKALMRQPAESIEARMDRENAIFASQLQSPEFAEAAAAFLERRAPDFDKLG
ncbi:enoyl-CoA hydratase [Maricaulis sp. W15]|uniref:Enoyl-CoA hydratase/carnithine racemase n=1 Tax=Maricaulis maris TaxID=74318 RepID=A0A495DDT5_9PROT|nr:MULTISPECIES: enoyl-CoA hydratase-related protein [Maricaulis]OLF80889.1 enoyl-CoA hydratase [Maricaulis sp. W15]RKR00482.1 enoyl-CoA hydratase/carnithine racemase [Maricaulis maris]